MNHRKDRITIGLIIILIFLFLIISGALFSGYHFVDDHEVIRIHNDLRTSSLINVIKAWVKEDLTSNARFRPVYYIHRVFETWLLGSDFFLWSVYNGVLCCLAIICFYKGIRNLRFTMGESIVFIIISFIGPQSSVWWRLGPGESLGIFFLGLSFYFMSKSPDKKHYQSNNLFFLLFLILASLTKESFMIIIPGMIFFRLWNDKVKFRISLKESIHKNLILIVPLLVFVIELFIIKYYVGTVYSALDSTFSDLITSIMSTILYFLKTYLNLIIFGLLLLIIYWRAKKRLVTFDLFAIVFFLLIITPNILLYARSGLTERYLIPTSFGLAFLVVTIINRIEDNPGWLKTVTLTIVLISFIPFLIVSFSEAKKFSKEGSETKRLLSAISTSYLNGNQSMVVVDPVESYEISISLKTYLLIENKIELFGYAILKDENNADLKEYTDGWKSYFVGHQFENLVSEPGLLIFLDKKLIDIFFKKSKLPQDDYLQVEIGDSHFALLKKK